MYTQAWNKYLPVIMILVKRSASSSPQTLAMDMNDFIKSSGGKKIKLGFAMFSLGNGRTLLENSCPPIARELVQLLSDKASFKEILSSRQLDFTMTNDCVLSIRNTENVAIQPA